MKQTLKMTLYIIAVIWIIFIANEILVFVDFNNWGIKPRTMIGLIGILTSPFLHANLSHIFSNSIPLFFLLIVLMTFYKNIWINVSILSMLLGGLAVWLVARENTNHIGASGVIFAYIGFLLASGIFRKSMKSIFISIIILFLYGGTLLGGVVPGVPGISWEGHLFGALSGVLIAWVYRKEKETTVSFKNLLK